MPPTLPPLYAMPSAAGRVRTNHGDTTALSAAALIVPQPVPLKTAATNSCHGAFAWAQAMMPVAINSAPILITPLVPKRRCNAGKLAPVIAPSRKCTLMAAEISPNDQPRVS